MECRYCNNRTVGCHSTCDAYKAFRKAKDEQNYKKFIEHKDMSKTKRSKRKNILSTHKIYSV